MAHIREEFGFGACRVLGPVPGAFKLFRDFAGRGYVALDGEGHREIAVLVQNRHLIGFKPDITPVPRDILDFAPERQTVAVCVLDGRNGFSRGVWAVHQVACSFSDGFCPGIAGDLGKGIVGPDDALIGIKDEHAVICIPGNKGKLFGFLSALLKLGVHCDEFFLLVEQGQMLFAIPVKGGVGKPQDAVDDEPHDHDPGAIEQQGGAIPGSPGKKRGDKGNRGHAKDHQSDDGRRFVIGQRKPGIDRRAGKKTECKKRRAVFCR